MKNRKNVCGKPEEMVKPINVIFPNGSVCLHLPFPGSHDLLNVNRFTLLRDVEEESNIGPSVNWAKNYTLDVGHNISAWGTISKAHKPKLFNARAQKGLNPQAFLTRVNLKSFLFLVKLLRGRSSQAQSGLRQIMGRFL
ncbi:hypothetical protein PanWU01x14_287640 [Parasponia andersonii]|uniref:Uncharacterized protein n=1 Tax=Parasponia andersonii TaxID=3476 RepID=A0A2P5AYY6_PARAD|nr:hypothetical protein PanWU01x14_287640 [Parasponia andersonii]